jgi:dUTP pyrophosphatase
MTIPINVQLHDANAKMPVYATSKDSGADVFACEEKTIPARGTRVINTGISVELPEGYDLQFRSRSGLASKGIVIANSPGTIDNQYRGLLKAIIHNNTPESYKINIGDKIGQLVVSPVIQGLFTQVDEIDTNTDRSTSGFGSTGK